MEYSQSELSPDSSIAEAAYDKALDDLVDKGRTYDEAREKLGPPPYEMADISVASSSRALGTIAAAHTTRYVRRRRNGNGPQFGEEEGVGYPEGKPPYYQPYVPLSEEQKATNALGLERARRAIADAKSPDQQD